MRETWTLMCPYVWILNNPLDVMREKKTAFWILVELMILIRVNSGTHGHITLVITRPDAQLGSGIHLVWIPLDVSGTLLYKNLIKCKLIQN